MYTNIHRHPHLAVSAAVVEQVGAGVHHGGQIVLEVVDACARAVAFENEVLDIRLDVLLVPSTDDNLVVGKFQGCQLVKGTKRLPLSMQALDAGW